MCGTSGWITSLYFVTFPLSIDKAIPAHTGVPRLRFCRCVSMARGHPAYDLLACRLYTNTVRYAMSSPTSRSLALLRKRGMIAEVVERWSPWPKPHGCRHDFLSCIDILSFSKEGSERGVLGVQATSLGNTSSRVAKAKCVPNLRHWLKAGNTFSVWGWAKKKNRWHCKEVPLSLSDLSHDPL